jgi:hypothetical protein
MSFALLESDCLLLTVQEAFMGDSAVTIVDALTYRFNV